MAAISDAPTRSTAEARRIVRAAMPVEADLAFRRRCETVIEYLDAGPDDTILDCGCGYGFYLRLLDDLTGATIVGLDPDQDRLDQCRQQLGDRSRVSYVRGDAQALPFPAESFSYAVCSEVLEHLDDDRAAMAELFRVLRPGGALALTVPSADYPAAWDPLNFMLERTVRRHLGGERPWSGIWYGHKRLYTMAQLRAVAEDAGFVIEEERPLTHACPPFAHLILYGTLKPLLLRGLLPGSLTSAGDRLSSGPKPPRGLTGLAMRLLERIDRGNDDPDVADRARTFVALSIKARKPG
jgi:ubiquinone/menaquinone biosynthesis C-methylase UbiE